jgi:RNA polymerase sigma-B factor
LGFDLQTGQQRLTSCSSEIDARRIDMPDVQPLKAVGTGSATGPPASAESDIRRRPTRTGRKGTSKRARENQRLLAQYHRDRDAAAREQLVCRLLPLARSIARRYADGPEPFDDLVQVASLGLIKAIDRFDPTREIAFSSFAVPTIVGALKRHFRDKGWAVRVPRDLQELAVRLDRVADDLSRQLGRLPTPTQIADHTGVSLEQVLEAREASAARRADSLDRPLSSEAEDGHSVADVVGDDDPGYGVAEWSATLEQLMTGLTERERAVLRLRFRDDLTQAQIGARVGLSQMQVSRLLRQSIAFLQETVARSPDARQPWDAAEPISTEICRLEGLVPHARPAAG